MKNDGQKVIYKDGVALTTQAAGAADLVDFTDLWIGSATNGGNRMTGYIDDFSVWDGALTADEVGFLANGGSVSGLVPEPTTLLIWSLLAGLGIGLGWRRRK